MEPPIQPSASVTPAETPTAPPLIQLSAEEQRQQQLAQAVNTSTSVLKMIVSALGRVLGEVVSLLMKR
jgi:hypothetical protein